MGSVPRDIGDQRKTFAQISSWADKIDKQGQGAGQGHAVGRRALGGNIKELQKDEVDSITYGKTSGADGT